MDPSWVMKHVETRSNHLSLPMTYMPMDEKFPPKNVGYLRIFHPRSPRKKQVLGGELATDPVCRLVHPGFVNGISVGLIHLPSGNLT